MPEQLIGPLKSDLIMLGDVVPMLEQVPGESFDVIFADWPYSQMSPVRGKDNGAAGRIYGPQAFLHRVLQQFHRVAAAGCHLYLFGDWRGIPDNGYAMSTTGWFPTTIIVWDKCYVGTGGFWRSGWDPIFFASKGPADKRTNKARSNVIRVPAVRRRAEHPAEKPLGLWEELCAVSVTEKTRVLDAFAGSGSSHEPVCAAGGLWFGIDIDPAWGSCHT